MESSLEKVFGAVQATHGYQRLTVKVKCLRQYFRSTSF